MAVTSAKVEGEVSVLGGTPHTMGIPIEVNGWHRPLCGTLRRILSLPPAQAHLFRSVLAHAAQHGAALAADAGSDWKGGKLNPEQFPLASFVLGFPAARQVTAIQQTLAWLVLEARLTGAGGSLVHDLAQIVRGLYRGEGSKLNQTILDCNGPVQLLTKMQRLGAEDPTRITGHWAFDDLWRKELGAFCTALIRQEDAIRDDAEEFGGALDQPGPLTESPLDAVGEDPEEGPHYPSLSVGTDQIIRGSPLRQGLNWSFQMSRRSSPDLLRPAENVLPPDLRQHAWMTAVHAAELAIAAVDLQNAEFSVVAVLSIESGLSAREALMTAFGSSATSGPVIDLELGALRRPEVLPPNCFLPSEGDDRWAPTGGDTIFPLSPRCIALLNALCIERLKKSSGASSLLLSPRTAADGRAVPVDSAKLRSAAKSAHRLVLAIHIANAMGIDAAQRAFGDTFGLSAAATFYGAYPALNLAQTVARANAFTEPDLRGELWLRATNHFLGSRVRPRDPPYARAWKKLEGVQQRGRGRPSDQTLIADWEARRDRLLVHFLLATAHRPSQSLFELTLHRFVPRDAMVLLSDKISGPAHLTRPVCTGWRFVGELEGFVVELKRISQKSGIGEARNLAASILAGTAPLFATPQQPATGAPRIQALLAQLDPLWGDRPNLHRHGLAQYLIHAGIDPELRYFQMGWLCHDHHATSDSAPYPVAKLGHELAEVIDRWLDSCGWLGGTRQDAPRNLIPLQRLTDWTSRKRSQVQSAQAARTNLKAGLAEVERGLESSVWQKISAEADRVLAEFTPSPPNEAPAFERVMHQAGDEVSSIGAADVKALLKPFQKRSCSAAQRYVATRMLHKALLRTARTTGARVFLPAVPVLSRSLESSPFIPEAGLAIAQVDFLHSTLVKRLVGQKITPSHDGCLALAATAAVSIVLRTPCPTLGDALTVLKAAGGSCYAEAEKWQLRVPTAAGHVVLDGDSAILARQLLCTLDYERVLEELARNNCSTLGAFLIRVVPELVPERCRSNTFLQLIESTASVAKPFHSNGPERLILRSAVQPALVGARRAASVADEVTLDPAIGAETVSEDQPAIQLTYPIGKPSHRPKRTIAKVMRAFDPDFEKQILGKQAKPVTERRSQLKRLLEHELANMDGVPTSSRLILEYSWHLLVEGGPRSSGGQAISTIWKTYHRLAAVLGNLSNEESLEELTGNEMTALIRAACQTSRRRSSKEVLEELRRFFRFAAGRCRIVDPDWTLLYRAYGIQVVGGDPALVSDIEAARVLECLHSHVDNLAGSDAEPAERRFREICLVAALIAEASGARPRSIHGLTLADAVLGADVDYVLLRPSGRYASIKTKTSAGFVPLEGALWEKYRGWFANWLCRACMTLPVNDLDVIPLFQIPGEAIGVRYELRKVFQPIGSLLRWSTGCLKARTYWLRKRRVRARHRRVQSGEAPRARDLAHAMRLSGHALVATPVSSYLSEPCAYLSGDTSAHAVSSRAGSAAMAQLRGANMRSALGSDGMGTSAHIVRLLRLERLSYEPYWLPEAPALPGHESDLTWRTVELVLRNCASGENRIRISARRGIEESQTESVIAAHKALSARLKVSLDASSGGLSPPRSTATSKDWYALMYTLDTRLAVIARDWVDMADARLFHEGCQLADPHAITLLKTVATELGVRFEESAAGHGTQLIRFVDQVGAQGAKRSLYGVWPTLRWLLSVVWIAEYRKRTLPRAAAH